MFRNQNANVSTPIWKGLRTIKYFMKGWLFQTLFRKESLYIRNARDKAARDKEERSTELSDYYQGKFEALDKVWEVLTRIPAQDKFVALNRNRSTE